LVISALNFRGYMNSRRYGKPVGDILFPDPWDCFICASRKKGLDTKKGDGSYSSSFFVLCQLPLSPFVPKTKRPARINGQVVFLFFVSPVVTRLRHGTPYRCVEATCGNPRDAFASNQNIADE